LREEDETKTEKEIERDNETERVAERHAQIILFTGLLDNDNI
jgi:hypothetical protein